MTSVIGRTREGSLRCAVSLCSFTVAFSHDELDSAPLKGRQYLFSRCVISKVDDFLLTLARGVANTTLLCVQFGETNMAAKLGLSAFLTVLAMCHLTVSAAPASDSLNERFSSLLSVSGLRGVTISAWSASTPPPCDGGGLPLPCVVPETKAIYVPTLFLERFPERPFQEAAVAHELAHLRLGHRLPETPAITAEADLDALFQMARTVVVGHKRAQTEIPSYVSNYAGLMAAIPQRLSGIDPALRDSFNKRRDVVSAVSASLPRWRDSFLVARGAFAAGQYNEAVKLLVELDAALPDSHELATNLGLAYLGLYFEHRLDRVVLDRLRMIAGTTPATPSQFKSFARAEVAAALARGFALAPDLVGTPTMMGATVIPEELERADQYLAIAFRLAPEEPRALVNRLTLRTELCAYRPELKGQTLAELEQMKGMLLAWPRDDQDLAWLAIGTFYYRIGGKGADTSKDIEAALAAWSHVQGEQIGALATYNRALVLSFDPGSTPSQRADGEALLRSLSSSVTLGPILKQNISQLAERASGRPSALPAADGRLRVQIVINGEPTTAGLVLGGDHSAALQKYLTEAAFGEEVLAQVTDERGAFMVMDRMTLLRLTSPSAGSSGQGPSTEPYPCFTCPVPPQLSPKPQRNILEFRFSTLPKTADPLSPLLPGEGERILVRVEDARLP